MGKGRQGVGFPDWGDVRTSSDAAGDLLGVMAAEATPTKVGQEDMFDLMEQGVGGCALNTLNVVSPDAPHTRCSVKRVKLDSGEVLFHMYQDNGEHLLTARPTGKKDGSMSFSQFKQESQHCIAELRPGKDKGEFGLWFNREGLVRTASGNGVENGQEICTICHDAIRDTPLYSMRVSVPDMATSERMGLASPEKDGYGRGHSPEPDVSASGVSWVRLRTKVPEWNEEMQSYTLDYNGRARLASAKNFQLEEAPGSATSASGKSTATSFGKGRSKSERRKSRRAMALAGVKLQFGKYDDNTFNLDYLHPLCGMQALAIALTTASWT